MNRGNDLTAVIKKKGKSPIRIEAWRYWSIMDALQWYGVDRQAASDLAKWCGRTHEELAKISGDVSIELVAERGKKNGQNLPDITCSIPD